MQLEWLPFTGHDGEGEYFNDLCYVASDGRICARIQLPNMGGEYAYQCEFMIPWCGYEGDRIQFIGLGPAKEFCEANVRKAIERARRKQPRKRRAKVTPEPEEGVKDQI